MLDDRQAGGTEERLHDVFVHAGRRAQNAGADIGDIREFEQPLNGAIFAKGAMQNGEDHVHVDRAVRCAAKRRSLDAEWSHTRIAMDRFRWHDDSFTLCKESRAWSCVGVSGAKGLCGTVTFA